MIIINTKENDIQSFEEKNDNYNPDQCGWCMGELENPIEIEKCNHKFCKECFHDYLKESIKNNKIDKIPCPTNKCKLFALFQIAIRMQKLMQEKLL